jgi:adenine-specific DNA-methyltransferase
VNPTGGGARVIYLDEVGGDIVDSVWIDIPPVNPIAAEREDFPTQKPEGIPGRLIKAFTNPGDIVLDCFIGSGTTAAVAQKLGRRWIGADINKGAIQTTEKRLATIIADQIAAGTDAQLALANEDGDAPPKPAQLAFSVYRVNDYDLQIQHNEAVELAVQHLGVARTRADTFFQGILGEEILVVEAR